MRESLLVLGVCTDVIIDMGCTCGDRVLAAAQAGGGAKLDDAIGDWQGGTGLAAIIGLAAGGWAAAAAVPRERRLARLTRPIGRYGPRGALLGGMGPLVAAGCVTVLRQAVPWEDRYTWETMGLFGATLGGLVGSVVGTGEGAAAYRSRRPPGEPGDDPERDDYRDGPGGSGGSAAEMARLPDGGGPKSLGAAASPGGRGR